MDLLWSDDITRLARERILNGNISSNDIEVLEAAYNDIVGKMQTNDFLRRMINGFNLSKRIKPLINGEPTENDLLDFFKDVLKPEDMEQGEKLNANLREVYDIMTSILQLSKVNNIEVRKVLLGYEYYKKTGAYHTMAEKLPIPEEGLIHIAKNLGNEPKGKNDSKETSDEEWLTISLLLENSELPENALYELTKELISRIKGSEEFKSFQEFKWEKHGHSTEEQMDEAFKNLVGDGFIFSNKSGIREYMLLKRIARYKNTPMSSLLDILNFKRDISYKRESMHSVRTDEELESAILKDHNLDIPTLRSVGKAQNEAVALIQTGITDIASKFMGKEDLASFRDLCMQLLLKERDIEGIKEVADSIQAAIINMDRSITEGEEEHQEDEKTPGENEDTILTRKLVSFMEDSNKRRTLALRDEKSKLQQFLDFIKNKLNELLHGNKVNEDRGNR